MDMEDLRQQVYDAISRARHLDTYEVTHQENVDCDEDCGALEEPETVEELHAALDHWRGHWWLAGCSHGC